jgi:sugar/nucleoside kinase (ribokinase family)
MSDGSASGMPIEAFVLCRLAADLYPLQAQTALDEQSAFQRFVGGFGGGNVGTGLARSGTRSAVLSRARPRGRDAPAAGRTHARGGWHAGACRERPRVWDAFAAAVGHGLLTKVPPERLLRMANASGAIVAAQLPCAAPMPRPDELEGCLAARA